MIECSLKTIGWLNDNSAAINAFLTLILTSFTGLLWLSTHRLWSVTKQSAEVLPKLERAYLFMQVETTTFRECFIEKAANIQPSVKFCFVNHGKTPAIIKSISADLELVPKDDLERPLTFHNGENIEGGEYIIPSMGSTTTYIRECSWPISPVLISNIQDAKYWIRFYGKVTYDDVFGERHETNFFWYYNGRAEKHNCLGSFFPYRTEGKNFNLRT